MPAHDIPHEDHAPALLVGRHEKRLLDCTANRVRLIGVYKEGLGELARCSGECRQYQYTLVIIACGNELLGHEIHPVMKTRNDAGICRPEELKYFGWPEMARDENNRLVLAVAVPGIDFFCQTCHVPLQLVISGKFRSSWCSSLQQDKSSLPGRSSCQEAINCLHALKYTLSVIEPLYPDRDLHVAC